MCPESRSGRSRTRGAGRRSTRGAGCRSTGCCRTSPDGLRRWLPLAPALEALRRSLTQSAFSDAALEAARLGANGAFITVAKSR